MKMSEPTTEIIVPEIKAFSPDVFDPRKEQLQEIADEVAKIEADPAKMDKDTLTLVNATKNKLVKARTTIEKTGKALRDPHTEFNRAVSSYENELIAIIEPQEKRLKAIEEDAKKIAIREERRLTLDEYKAKLATIGDNFAISDDELLEFDPNQRDAYYNQRLGAHLQAQKAEADERDRLANEEQQRLQLEKESLEKERFNNRVRRLLTVGFKEIGAKIVFGDNDIVVEPDFIKVLGDTEFEKLYERLATDAQDIKVRLEEEAKKKHEEEIKVAAETAAKEAAEKAQKEADDKEAKRLADEEVAKKAKEEQEEQEAAELAARQSAEAFQVWLNENSYNATTDNLVEYQDGNRKVTILYRVVGRYMHD